MRGKDSRLPTPFFVPEVKGRRTRQYEKLMRIRTGALVQLREYVPLYPGMHGLPDPVPVFTPRRQRLPRMFPYRVGGLP